MMRACFGVLPVSPSDGAEAKETRGALSDNTQKYSSDLSYHLQPATSAG